MIWKRLREIWFTQPPMKFTIHRPQGALTVNQDAGTIFVHGSIEAVIVAAGKVSQEDSVALSAAHKRGLLDHLKDGDSFTIESLEMAA